MIELEVTARIALPSPVSDSAYHATPLRSSTFSPPLEGCVVVVSCLSLMFFAVSCLACRHGSLSVADDAILFWCVICPDEC